MTILVPYDGSEPAQEALKRAVRSVDDEDVVVLRVIEVAGGSIEAGIDIVQEKLQERREAEADALSDEVEALIESEDVELRTEIAAGRPAREVVSFAEEEDVSEIVMGSHGREGISRVLLGSVAEKVVRRAPTTVTVVR